MYDYFSSEEVEEQVKLFYIPIFSEKSIGTKDSVTWQSGGRMRSFRIGDELPLRTLYYNYPENFMIFDYRFNHQDIWIVKNGKLHKRTTISELTEEEIITPVFNNYGSPLRIKTLADFTNIQKDEKESFTAYKTLEKEWFPNGGVLQTIRDNQEEFLTKQEEWEKVRDTPSDHFYETWFVQEGFRREKDFGELIFSYLSLQERRGNEKIGDFPSGEELFQTCRSYIHSVLQETPSLLEDYKAWLTNEPLLQEINFEELIEDIQTAPTWKE